MKDECKGLIGKFFGHKFEHIFSVEQFIPMNIDVNNIFQLLGQVMFTNQIDLINSLKTKTSIYRFSICKRCGQTINKENNYEKTK